MAHLHNHPIAPLPKNLRVVFFGSSKYAVIVKKALTDKFGLALVAFILVVAFIVKWVLDPQMGAWGKAAAPTLGFNFASVMNLNFVVMGIVAGIVIVNVFKIPEWAE